MTVMEYYWIRKDYNYQDLAWIDNLPLMQDGKPDLRWYTPSGIFFETNKTFIVDVPRGSRSKKRPTIYFFGNSFFMIPPKLKHELEKKIEPNICQFVEFVLFKEWPIFF